MVHACNKEREIGMILQKLSSIDKKIDSFTDSVRLNTEFRLQAKGVFGFIAFIFTALGGFFMWLFQAGR